MMIQGELISRRMRNVQMRSTLKQTNPVTLFLKYTGNFISPDRIISTSPSPISSSSYEKYCLLNSLAETVCIDSAMGVGAIAVNHFTKFPQIFLFGVFSLCPLRELQFPVRQKSFILPGFFTYAERMVNWIFFLLPMGYRLTDSLVEDSAEALIGEQEIYWAEDMLKGKRFCLSFGTTLVSKTSSSSSSKFSSPYSIFQPSYGLFFTNSLSILSSESSSSKFYSQLGISLGGLMFSSDVSSICLSSKSDSLLSTVSCSLVGASEAFSFEW